MYTLEDAELDTLFQSTFILCVIWMRDPHTMQQYENRWKKQILYIHVGPYFIVFYCRCHFFYIVWPELRRSVMLRLYANYIQHIAKYVRIIIYIYWTLTHTLEVLMHFMSSALPQQCILFFFFFFLCIRLAFWSIAMLIYTVIVFCQPAHFLLLHTHTNSLQYIFVHSHSPLCLFCQFVSEHNASEWKLFIYNKKQKKVTRKRNRKNAIRMSIKGMKSARILGGGTVVKVAVYLRLTASFIFFILCSCDFVSFLLAIVFYIFTSFGFLLFVFFLFLFSFSLYGKCLVHGTRRWNKKVIAI